ncbi:hypothetical protein H0H92_006066 [Tricholoma furcatifolium]|nr:hypothetical protein H0H92_006066 [Tricholoma furcatifolium]
MAGKDLRQRKSVSREGEKKVESESETSNGTKTNETPQSTPTASGFSKGFVGLLALILAALLYNNVSLRQPSDSNIVEEQPSRLPADLERRDAIVNAFKHAWSAYERDAFGDDNYHPISKKGSNLTEAGGVGYTIVDTLDTLQIMGLDAEYARARKWVANSLSFDRDAEYNTFEMTIRVIGGLLSAHHLSGGDRLYLERAKDLADRLMPVFDSPSGLPLSYTNLKTRIPAEDTNEIVTTSEVASLQLELRYLSYLTEREEYWDKAENVIKIIQKELLPSGFPTVFMKSDTGKFLMSQVRLGSKSDSYYEYLLKQYLQTGQTESVYREMYESTTTAIHNSLLRKSADTNLTYTIELIPERGRRGVLLWNNLHKQDHLACFIGGNLLLGSTTSGSSALQVSVPPLEEELTAQARRDWKTGIDLIETCMDTYKRTATGLAPEVVHFRVPGEREFRLGNKDWYIKDARSPGWPAPPDARYLLRPETIESLFIAYRLTGDEKYRQYGWDIFQAIEKYCRVETGGYATKLNVDDVNSKLDDKMDSYFLSETLKYLYLLYSDSNLIPFNNTGKPYGPEFPPTTIRDDVRIHKLVLDYLGVKSVAVAIGGSMGGMAVLEWPLCSPPGFIRHVIPLATSARHSAWCISWGEAQRQSIYSDPLYLDGFYATQPASGLAAARMSALLTYRSRDSFESRFGRKPQFDRTNPPPISEQGCGEPLEFHNDGHKNATPRSPGSPSCRTTPPNNLPAKPPIFSAQSYLRYQGDKFTARFDANCYIHITRKMDTHDVARGRAPDGSDESLALAQVLSTLPPRSLVISIATDGLFTTTEQRELAAHIPDAELVVIPSPDGHDGFLLEFEQINTHVQRFLRREFPEIYEKEVAEPVNGDFEIKKTSIFGEAEVDITRW